MHTRVQGATTQPRPTRQLFANFPTSQCTRLAECEHELTKLEARLRSHAVMEKRHAVFDAAMARLATVPLETLRERKHVEEHTEELPVLMARWGDAVDCTLLLPKRSRKRARVTAEQAALLQAGVPWAAVQEYEPHAALAHVATRVLCGGYVRVCVRPSDYLCEGVHAGGRS